MKTVYHLHWQFVVAALTMCATAALSPGVAFAQAASTEVSERPQRRVIEEVVVTAQKRQESLQDVPIALSAFSSEALSNMGVSSTQDLQLSTPGLVYTNIGPVAQPYLRGVGTRLVFNGLDPSVATYIEDRYAPRAAGNIMEFGLDVERVEVLKGPQGTLYGRNATGGAIRVLKKDVTDEFEGALKATLGNYDRRDLAGTVNVPLGQDFGVRLSGLVKRRDGYADNITRNEPGAPDELDDRNLKAFNANFRWDVSERVTSRLLVDYWDQNDRFGADAVVVEPLDLHLGLAIGGRTGRDVDEVATTNPSKQDGDELSSQLRFDIALDAVDLVSITTFTDFALDWTAEPDGTSAELLDPGVVSEEADTYSQELRLVSRNGGRLEWMTGVFYYFDDHRTEVRLDTAILPKFSQGVQDTETTAYAGFGELTWHLADRWALTLGGRYSVEERKTSVKESREPGFSTAGAGAMPFRADEEWSEFTPRVVLEYELGETLLYASYSRGFKSGGYNYPALSTPDGLDPEILDMVELGLKGDYFNRTLRVNTALFAYDYKDLQVTRAATGTGTVTTENAADAEVLGLDLDVTWMPTDALTLQSGLGLLDSEYKDYQANAKFFRQSVGLPGPGMVDRGFDASGEQLLRASDWSAFVTATYEFRVANGRLPVSLTYSYKDDYFFDFVVDPLTKKFKQEGYGLLNGRVSYHTPDERWIVSLWGRNLTDETYFDEITGNFAGMRGSYGVPRTYGADLEYRF